MKPIIVTGDVTPLAAALRRVAGRHRAGAPTVVHFDGYDPSSFLRLRRAAALASLRKALALDARFVLVTPRSCPGTSTAFVEKLADAFGRAHELDTAVVRAGSGEPRPWRPSACGVRRALPYLLHRLETVRVQTG